MKLTWFSGTTMRLHIGGQMLVADAALAPAEIDPVELVSGADRTFSLVAVDPELQVVDATAWRPRRMARLVEAAAAEVVHVLRIGDSAVLVDAAGEPAAVLVASQEPIFGRWADGSVVVLFGNGISVADVGMALLQASRPRVIALAVADGAVDLVVDALRERLDGAGLMALEPGMAVEV